MKREIWSRAAKPVGRSNPSTNIIKTLPIRNPRMATSLVADPALSNYLKNRMQGEPKKEDKSHIN
jgi:hypothetical protein